LTTTGIRQQRIQCKYPRCTIMIGWTKSDYCFTHYKRTHNIRAFKFCMRDKCHSKIRNGDFYCDIHKYLERLKRDKCEVCGEYA